ncbi:kinase D-interacting substrate of 220 kDa-like [Poecilia reticulata]|uniref:kinase D-interacting substrate of 220 kDa-like n=1 Tax=Poecilia reticulata TaxID=8081 RepID=UPI0007EA8E78|nr:PREDICTED: kinase D-interacting substrate of 220 kDa-like [Poecilia reticulata]
MCLDFAAQGGWTALMWAAYKGRTEVARLLLDREANPNITGQVQKTKIISLFITLKLIWASRKGNYDSVMHLLANGADVDQEGANSMTALIVAVKGGHTDVVKELLKRNPNVNMTDKDGNTALAIAAKEGHTEIVQDLLDAGTYVNNPDRSGETVLIGAVRGGHVEIVQALLNKYADVDVRGQDGKTALYWAVEKGNAAMVRDILQCNPDTENSTKDGETPLIKATKMRSIDVVELLLDKGAKVSAVDRKGDTALHIAIRGRSRKLAELLLRNPKDGRLLYRPNKAGETPYNIDCTHQKSILTQIFGAKHLSPTESDGDMLGYDLYSSALADILSEPTMQPPICVGLYAQWGSGKSFLLKKLEDEMKTFAGQQIEPLFQFSWLVVFLTLLLCGSVAVILGFTVDPRLAIAVSLSLLALLYTFFGEETNERRKANASQPQLTVGCLITGVVLLSIFRVDSENLTVNAVLIAMASVVGLALLINFRTWWQVADSVLNSQRKRLHGAANNLHKLKSEGFMKVLKHEVEMMSKMAKTIDGFTQNQTRMAVIIDGLDACEQDRVLQMLDTVRVLFSKGPFISIFASDPHIIIKAINQNLNSVLRDSNINGHDYMRNIVHLPVFLNSRGLSRAKKLCVATPTNGEADGCHDDVDRRVSMMSLAQDQVKVGSKTALNRRVTHAHSRVFVSCGDFTLTSIHFLHPNPHSTSPCRLLRAHQIIFNWDRLASWIHLTEEWPYRTSWIILFLEEAEAVSDQVTLKTIYERISKNIPTTKDVEPLLEIDGDIRSFEVFLSSRTPVLVARDVETFLPCTVNLDPKLREIIAGLDAVGFTGSPAGLPLMLIRETRGERRCAPTRPGLAATRRPAARRWAAPSVAAAPELDSPHKGPIVLAGRIGSHSARHSAAACPLQEAAPRPPPGFGPLSAAGSPTGSFGGALPPQPHSAYFSGMTGPQHPFYNRPYFPHHVYQLPRPYAPLIAPSSSRPFAKPPASLQKAAGLPCPVAPLSSLGTDAVCERLRQIDGMDPSMLPQYAATITKANINGRVLTHCNLDELKREMDMNFGDWQLFRGMVMEQRHAETQAALQEESRAASEQGSSVLHGESGLRPAGTQRDGAAPFGLALSFEELSGVGLEEPPRRSGNPQWTATNPHTCSMSSLNSQESSNDICKLTDKQQAEYRDAYREYVAQMAQLEMTGSGAERPVQPHPNHFLQASCSEDKGAKEGTDPDGRKPFKRASKSSDTTDFASGADAPLLDPISEEDENHSLSSRTAASKKAAGSFYHKLPSEDDSGPEEADNTTPLLHKAGRASPPSPGFRSDVLEKKDSDSGMRSSDSSLGSPPEQAGGAPNPGLIELELEGLVRKRGLLPSRLQDAAVARMSICSDAPSEASLMASSPDEGWPADSVSNLNRAASTTTLNNNSTADDPNSNSNNSRQRQENFLDSSVIIHPGSTAAAVHQNQNLCSINLGDERESVL